MSDDSIEKIMNIARPLKISKGITQKQLDEFNIPENEDCEFPESETGAKREKMNSIRYDYLPMLPVVESYSRVADFGAQKYAPWNWAKGIPQSQISSSLQRHLWAYMEGQDKDPESGLSHLDHMLWNAIAMVYNEYNKIQDDRFKNIPNHG